jgi:hypothetical protein
LLARNWQSTIKVDGFPLETAEAQEAKTGPKLITTSGAKIFRRLVCGKRWQEQM